MEPCIYKIIWKGPILLSEYFDKQFFYKGPKWKNEYPPMDITVITNIQADNGLIRIGIENVTYPHKGHFILDLDKYKIIEAKVEV